MPPRRYEKTPRYAESAAGSRYTSMRLLVVLVRRWWMGVFARRLGLVRGRCWTGLRFASWRR